MKPAKLITAYLRDQREEMIQFLSELVRAESPSTSPEAQAAPLALLWDALNGLGFTVRIIGGQKTGGHLLAEPAENDAHQSDGSRQLLIGHCDTVWPIGTLKEMPLQVENGRIRGPGVYDMKGGLTQMIFALKTLNVLDLRPRLAPVIFVNSDEEIGSIESRSHIIRLAQEVQRAFILEPALGLEGKLKTARKGVGIFEVIVHGRAAHAGLEPEKGISAILALSHVIQDLYSLNDLSKGITVNVGTIDGGLRTNVIAPQSRAAIDVRVPTMSDARQIEKEILNLKSPIPGSRLEINGGFNRPPLEATPSNQELWQRAQGIGNQLGIRLQNGMAGGGSDGNFTSQYTPTLDGLGAVGDGAHAQHEFLIVDKMAERAALLALLMLTS